MRIIVALSIVVALILLYSSIQFGFDLQTAFYTFLYLIVFCIVTYFAYDNLAGVTVPKIWFYVVAGIFFSFCFYPLLEFYSMKPSSYGWLDWAGMSDKNFRLGFVEKMWYGKWYGKLIFTLFCTIVAVLIQQIFDNKD